MLFLRPIPKPVLKLLAKRLLYRFIAILYIVFIFSTSFFFFLIACAIWLFTRPFDRRLRALHRFTCLWASLYIWVFPPWAVEIEGREHIDQNETYVIVSNHQSMVDILAAFMLFRHFKWVSKAELFRIPLIGWNMALNRYVRLKRGHKASIRDMYEACETHLREGSSIFLFPEGTRSETGKMREFKEGAFVLAKRHSVPILPVVINGSKNALPKDSLNFHGKTHVRLQVLPPVPAETFTETTVEDLRTQVRELIRGHVDEEAMA